MLTINDLQYFVINSYIITKIIMDCELLSFFVPLG